MAHKVENVYSMALYRKSLLTPAPGESRPGGRYICWERGGWLPLGWMPADAAGTCLNRKGGVEENGGGLIGTAKH